jgi:hypothetical protein
LSISKFDESSKKYAQYLAYLSFYEYSEVVMKTFIISILEPVLSIFIVVYTLFGFIFGGTLGGLSRGLFGGPSFSLGWALAGGIAFFLIAVVGTGTIFTLLAIRELLEEQLKTLKSWEQNRRS